MDKSTKLLSRNRVLLDCASVEGRIIVVSDSLDANQCMLLCLQLRRKERV